MGIVQETKLMEKSDFSIESFRNKDLGFVNFTELFPKDFDGDPEDVVESFLSNLIVSDDLRYEVECFSRVDFVRQEELEPGRDNSRNGAFFGTLYFKSFSPGVSDASMQVAVKPFEEQRYLANELMMFAVLDRLGLNHPKAVAVLKSKTEDKSYLVTKFQPELVSLDSMDWDNFSVDMIQTVLSRSVKDLVGLHSNAVQHGDYHPRNAVILPDKTATYYLDLEHSRRLPATHREILFAVKEDLKSLYFGVGSRIPDHDNFNTFLTLVFEPYCDSVLMQIHETQPQSTAPVRYIQDLLSLLALEFEREFSGEPLTGQERIYHLGCISTKRGGVSIY